MYQLYDKKIYFQKMKQKENDCDCYDDDKRKINNTIKSHNLMMMMIN